jgi:threonine/homoserine efflux transporter RhtA
MRLCCLLHKGPEHRGKKKKEDSMSIHVSLQPLLALLAGILILVMPKMLHYIIAVYLIIYAIIGLVR